ncbi:hypothetical protein BS333_21020 (plasmid) [Vibrio azureus]|uniref:Uncharacterized protein n=1 Tax=Vibrio azureus NBRC 104587 TaxID=1219077 RepID=U3C167_9VIBR|nr:hypothetical protein [Vibrio azureus]AUI88858.1 hypothetical protein BS333_21020 [Vibrio azureus]GAD75249.1 hypothetical protein VAZ01S_023_00160 [Vibrio azureus NBRC 104587]
MIRFITDIKSPQEPDILTPNRFNQLLIVSLEGQLLATYNAPMNGWTHDVLVRLSRLFPQQWGYCGADALLGDQFVGSTEI